MRENNPITIKKYEEKMPSATSRDVSMKREKKVGAKYWHVATEIIMALEIIANSYCTLRVHGCYNLLEGLRKGGYTGASFAFVICATPAFFKSCKYTIRIKTSVDLKHGITYRRMKHAPIPHGRIFQICGNGIISRMQQYPLRTSNRHRSFASDNTSKVQCSFYHAVPASWDDFRYEVYTKGFGCRERAGSVYEFMGEGGVRCDFLEVG